MRRMDKLSIITINFNDKIGLEKTFNSVVNQTSRDFEFIIIDGASTDGGKEFLEFNSEKIDYWISEKDSGVYNAMNKGIKAANGHYLLFLNSGDYLVSNDIIEKIIPLLNSNKSIYYGDLYCSKEGIRTSILNPPDKLTFSYFLVNSLPHPTSFIKKELFERYFLYNEALKIVSDWEFFIYAICKMNESYEHLNIIISDFDYDGLSSNPKNQNIIIQEKESVLKEHFPLLLEDSKIFKEIQTKRFKQFFLIKKSKISWKILKFFINILMLFQSKKNKQSSYLKKI